ncbi:DUF2304 domain-containing protein [Eubacterium xylanophilum]|uniref:DUF2304 domain-containing protein n=1 Tax=Eubacterium xylanophilum TaxID=39497 RepID=UPI00047C19FB|nr:DUF2304 domain-containing protein [Eubacterium xylanophilum]MCR5797354.1 DUF2304 domain-containing protein [Eubacterium sp.]
MTIRLQLIVAGLVLLMLIYVSRMISKDKIDVKYALRWLALCVLVLILDFFPGILYWLAGISGIHLPSNMIFLVAILLLIMTVFALTANVSRVSQKNTRLIQEVALLRDEIERLQEKEKK